MGPSPGQGAMEQDVFDVLERLWVTEASPHPRRAWEKGIAAIARLLKKQPTLPCKVLGGQWTQEELDRGVLLPRQHCPFDGCVWRGEKVDELLAHVREDHYTRELQDAVASLGGVAFKAALYTVLNSAVSVVCQQRPPVVSLAQDRRALKVFHESISHSELQGLICFCCGCVHPHLPGEARQKVAWKRAGPAGTGRDVVLETFLGLNKQQVEDFFGIDTYLKQFGNLGPGFPNLRDAVWQGELEEWQCTLRFEEGEVRILCNAEDRRCECEHGDDWPDVCPQCEIPICFSCQKALQSRPQQMPVRALSNNLWTGFAAPVLAEENVSYLEAILASPCMLSLVCFSLETRYGNVILEEAQHQRFRVGARSNITLFPLPLEDIFQELQRQAVEGMKLPWVGREIAHAVRVVLRTSEVTDARVIAQARVCRDIVVRLLEDAVRRQHLAYGNVRMEDVLRKAEGLPADGVLEELVSLARRSQSFVENLQAAKHGTPPLGEREKEKAFESLRPTAVTCTRNAYEEVCAGEADGRAWQGVAAAVRGEEMHVFTGSEMVNQFTSDFFCQAGPGVWRECFGWQEGGEGGGPCRPFRLSSRRR